MPDPQFALVALGQKDPEIYGGWNPRSLLQDKAMGFYKWHLAGRTPTCSARFSKRIVPGH
jgi:hypothetical protein